MPAGRGWLGGRADLPNLGGKQTAQVAVSLWTGAMPAMPGGQLLSTREG